VGRIWVVPASKKTVSSLFCKALSRSVPQRSIFQVRARASIFSALRPIRIGSGMTLSPLESVTPPWSRIATMERIRCWFMPMRPVTPCMMIPRECVGITYILSNSRPSGRLDPSYLLLMDFEAGGLHQHCVGFDFVLDVGVELLGLERPGIGTQGGEALFHL